MANKQPLFLFVEFLKSETTGLLHIKKFDVDNAFPESFTYVSYDEYCRVIESLRRENEDLKAKLDKAKWQPIETAPKDGKSILVTDGFEVCDAYFRGGDWWQYECGDDWYSTSINPTHWMPLPDAPEQR